MFEFSDEDIKFIEDQTKEGFIKDTQIKDWIAQGYCVHKLAGKVSECILCKSIIENKI